MKMKMKLPIISSIFNSRAKIDENVIVSMTHNVVHGSLDTMWDLIQHELQLQILVTNIHVIKYEKNIELANEIARFNGLDYFS